MTTRADPPLPLSRLRARGELVEVRAADLRFTAGEAEAFLNDVMGCSSTRTRRRARRRAPRAGRPGCSWPRCPPACRRDRAPATSPASSRPSPAATGSSSTTSSRRSWTAAGRGPRVPARHVGARRADRPAVRRADRPVRRSADAGGARAGEPVPHPARRPAPVVPLPPPVRRRAARPAAAGRPDRVAELHRAASRLVRRARPAGRRRPARARRRRPRARRRPGRARAGRPAPATRGPRACATGWPRCPTTSCAAGRCSPSASGGAGSSEGDLDGVEAWLDAAEAGLATAAADRSPRPGALGRCAPGTGTASSARCRP